MTQEPRFAANPGDTPLTHPPADYFAGGEPRWLILAEGPDAGKRLFFLDRRLGEGDGPTILLVHGNPECSYTYRDVISALADRRLPSGTRIVAPDHIGFGLSDQASYEMVDMHHARNLAQLVHALDLHDITLVVHDWGGPIGIGALLSTPERVRNLVVLNTTVFPMPPDGFTYRNFPIPVLFPWARTAKTIPDTLWGTHSAIVVTSGPGNRLRLLGRYCRLMLADRCGRVSGPQPDAFTVFRDQFTTKRNVRSSKRMVRQSAVIGHGYAYIDKTMGPQDNHEFYASIQARIGELWGPHGQAIGAAGVFGSFDPLGKPSVVDQWRAALPQIARELHVFDGETHFIEERHPDVIAAAIERLNQHEPSGLSRGA